MDVVRLQRWLVVCALDRVRYACVRGTRQLAHGSPRPAEVGCGASPDANAACVGGVAAVAWHCRHSAVSGVHFGHGVPCGERRPHCASVFPVLHLFPESCELQSGCSNAIDGGCNGRFLCIPPPPCLIARRAAWDAAQWARRAAAQVVGEKPVGRVSLGLLANTRGTWRGGSCGPKRVHPPPSSGRTCPRAPHSPTCRRGQRPTPRPADGRLPPAPPPSLGRRRWSRPRVRSPGRAWPVGRPWWSPADIPRHAAI